jgi:hypothetical protein
MLLVNDPFFREIVILAFKPNNKSNLLKFETD